METEKQAIGLEAQCWSCAKVWNISLLKADAKAVRCECGGFVVTEDGKALTRPFYDEFDSRAPLLEENDFKGKQIILSTDVKQAKKDSGIILP